MQQIGALLGALRVRRTVHLRSRGEGRVVGKSLGGVVVCAIDVLVFLEDSFSLESVCVYNQTLRLSRRCTAS